MENEPKQEVISASGFLNLNQLSILLSIAILPVAVLLAFGQPTLPDRAYGALLGDPLLGSIPIELLRYGMVVAAIASALLVYFALNRTTTAWWIALLVCLAPAVMVDTAFLVSPRDLLALLLFALAAFVYQRMQGMQRAVALLPLAAGLYIAYWNFSLLSNLLGIGFLLPLTVLAVWVAKQREDTEALALFALAVAGAAVTFPLALAASALAAARGVSSVVETNEKIVWSIAVAAVGFYLLLFTGDNYPVFVVMALAIGGVFHLVLSLYEIRSRVVGLGVMILLLLNLTIGYSALQKEAINIPRTEVIQAFHFLQAQPGESRVALLQFNNSYAYYTGKQAVMLAPSDLLGETVPSADYVLLPAETLFTQLAPSLRTYAFLQTDHSSAGSRAIYINNQYVLLVTLGSNGREIVNAISADQANQRQASIAFTKLRPLARNATLTDSHSVLVNTDGIEDTNLYKLLTQEDRVYEKDGVVIFRWQ